MLMLALCWLPPVRAQEAGVLLGLGTSGQGIHTLWITDIGGNPTLVSDFRDLLVPRKTGFWKVGIAHPCSADNFSGEIRAMPIGASAPSVDCKTRDESAEVLPSLTFVSPNYLSAAISENSIANHTPTGFSLIFSSLDHLSSPQGKEQVPFIAIFGSNATKAFEDAMKAAEAQYKSTGHNCNTAASLDTSTWGIRHFQDHWIVVGWSPTSDKCGLGLDYDIPVQVPESVATSWKAPIPWGELAQQIPGTRSVVVSPTGKLVLVLTSSKITAVPIEDGKLGPALDVATLRDPESCSRAGQCEEVVMAEWATGKSETRWNAEIQDYMKRGWLVPIKRGLPSRNHRRKAFR